MQNNSLSTLPKVTAFVPIKLNSERLPRKNLKNLGGLPLYLHVLKTLSNIAVLDEVYVFCSDDTIKGSLPYGVKFLKRDTRLDRNETRGAEIYDSFMNAVKSDYYMILHTTSPFIKQTTIETSIKNVLEGQYDSAFPARVIQNFCWYKETPINYQLDKIPRTQDLQPILEETSAFFLFSRELWINSRRRIGFKPYIAELEDREAVDIDTDYDFRLAEFLIEDSVG